MYNIDKEIENEIYKEVNKILDEYLDGKTFGTRHAREVLTKADFDSFFDGKKMSLKDAKKNFNKKKNLKSLINDMRFPAFQNFKKNLSEEDEETQEIKYQDLVKTILNKVIKDRISLEKDKKNNNKIMENITRFGDYEALNEMQLPIMKFGEILDEVSKVSNKTLKTILVTHFKTYLEYIDLVDKNSHIFRINDMTGDVMNNNRMSFDAIIFDTADIQQIKTNIVNYSIGEFYTHLPQNIDVFGIEMTPTSFINKEELRIVFENFLMDQKVVDIISNITGFTFEKKFNDFYIWSKK
jgi:hypothetical protein